MCSCPLLDCSKRKLRTITQNEITDLREIFAELFLILLQVRYQHLKKLLALAMLILPVVCASETLGSNDLHLAWRPNTAVGPNEYQSLQQGCLQLSVEETGMGDIGEKLFED